MKKVTSILRAAAAIMTGSSVVRTPAKAEIEYTEINTLSELEESPCFDKLKAKLRELKKAGFQCGTGLVMQLLEHADWYFRYRVKALVVRQFAEKYCNQI